MAIAGFLFYRYSKGGAHSQTLFIKERTSVCISSLSLYADVMGSALGVTIDFSGAKAEDKDLEDKDDRRRNSLAFYISQFVEYEEDDFGPLILLVQKDKNAKNGGKPPTIRNSSKIDELFRALLYHRA